ncbi:MAG TPA: hypothetical protein VNA20_07895 [Frankiaceae bacterium]|nr:hypothetical protein [Frankiaceae bacterium]
MTGLPPYDALRGVDSGVLNGLLHERATPAYEATYEYKWQKDAKAYRASVDALAAAAAGAEPAAPRDAPPRWLAPVARRFVVSGSTTRWGGAFEWVRLLERLGLLVPEHDDAYVLSVVGAAGRLS